MIDPTEGSRMDKLDEHLMYLYAFRKDIDMEKMKLSNAISNPKNINPDLTIIETNVEFLGSQYDSIIKKLGKSFKKYTTGDMNDLHTLYNNLEDFKDEISYHIDILQEIQYAYGRPL